MAAEAERDALGRDGTRVRHILVAIWRRRSTILPVAALLLVVAFFAIRAPVFLSLGNIQNIVNQSALLLIVAGGATFIILQGSIDLSVGSVVTLCGAIAALLLRSSGLGTFGTLIVATLAGGLVGALNGTIFAYGGVPSFLATLGTMFAFDGVALMLLHGAPVMIQNDGFVTLAQSFVLGVPTLALFSFGIYFLTVLIAFRTKFGRYIYAIGGGERVARLSGVNVNRFKLYSFTLAGLLAGLAGVLMASRIEAGAPRMGESLLLDAIAAVVVGGTALSGGMGGPHRTILGVFVIGCLSNGMNVTAVDPYVQIVIKGAVVIAAVFLTLDKSKVDVIK